MKRVKCFNTVLKVREGLINDLNNKASKGLNKALAGLNKPVNKVLNQALRF